MLDASKKEILLLFSRTSQHSSCLLGTSASHLSTLNYHAFFLFPSLAIRRPTELKHVSERTCRGGMVDESPVVTNQEAITSGRG